MDPLSVLLSILPNIGAGLSAPAVSGGLSLSPGSIIDPNMSMGLGMGMGSQPCMQCSRTGRVNGNMCNVCSGTGMMQNGSNLVQDIGIASVLADELL